ncbi:hypothetical protein CUMW_234340 [Citrus unshiu]|uniref:Uncharacterized protein n=2 Tax=Citrus TaxID=2706 RepID=A0A067D5I4_CITSI|nr:hypothetical protein CISIN_1g035044mg [Citrus sinensis]GAY64537.1 hypothetical protein CUMW_234340 [Citrus unshiu]
MVRTKFQQLQLMDLSLTCKKSFRHGLQRSTITSILSSSVFRLFAHQQQILDGQKLICRTLGISLPSSSSSPLPPQ